MTVAETRYLDESIKCLDVCRTTQGQKNNARSRATIHSSTTTLLNKMDDELGKIQCDHDALEVLIIKEECLYKLDGEIEKKTETDDMEAEVARALEYQDHIILRKTKARRPQEDRSEA